MVPEIEAIATPHRIGLQSHFVVPNATYSTRPIAPKAAILVHDAMNAVTGVGAP